MPLGTHMVYFRRLAYLQRSGGKRLDGEYTRWDYLSLRDRHTRKMVSSADLTLNC